jgi:hypothetical protein
MGTISTKGRHRVGALDAEQVEGLLARIGKGLNLFVGRYQAARLVDQRRRDLGAQWGTA